MNNRIEQLKEDIRYAKKELEQLEQDLWNAQEQCPKGGEHYWVLSGRGDYFDGNEPCEDSYYVCAKCGEREE